MAADLGLFTAGQAVRALGDNSAGGPPIATAEPPATTEPPPRVEREHVPNADNATCKPTPATETRSDAMQHAPTKELRSPSPVRALSFDSAWRKDELLSPTPKKPGQGSDIPPAQLTSGKGSDLNVSLSPASTRSAAKAADDCEDGKDSGAAPKPHLRRSSTYGSSSTKSKFDKTYYKILGRTCPS